jgi:uncharacterized surface protein with fasciclin (FAS1) repeats
MKKPAALLVAVLILALLLAAAGLVACGSDEESSTSEGSSSASDVATALQDDEQLSQYSEAFAAAGISGEGPFTVFAASNDAITEAGATLDADAVKASVFEGESLAPADLEGFSEESMLADNKLTTYRGTNGAIYVNDMETVGEPIEAGNGMVYVVKGVILPEE